MITMGKPTGIGFPVSGVAPRPEIVREFGERARYFNTFGANPVAAAAGRAVLDVIKDEALLANASHIGGLIRKGLMVIASRHYGLGDVRGLGLFLAVECVIDRDENGPNAARAGFIVNHRRQNGVLISATGPGANTLNIRPPLVLEQPEANLFLNALDAAFAAAIPQ
ncbi:aminotransferase class III-fold pyridoxal phosphate-dependent enzyme [Pseudorhodobacter sp.]|uniref:aminotransferase class III-fold pyridoxal phosphate-dependent enzyme n=1 Tax=Pseudorhodobacter sp. TaxID=1934400 RepID=UPI002647AD1B|nr:aminotransferase class III-fold pyridoxal phosphate-dependent enzyme [Pseudorhodobacter sp.]